jgi:hydrogenase expression/formation protein HypE
MQSNGDSSGFVCPVPLTRYPYILLAHGGGGKLTHELISRMILPAFCNPMLAAEHDGATLEFLEKEHNRLAFTTDSFVVRPLFFPGGDIGKLAVNGTVNDLAMCGARPLYLSAGFILEEGLPMSTLARVVDSMREAAQVAQVQIVTGDTKVVEKGKGDGIFINTAGIGILEHSLKIAPASVRAGDAILLSGDLGRHGITIMAAREGLEFETSLASDCAPLSQPVLALLQAGITIHCMRDLTRGGLASALVEIAESARLSIEIEEKSIGVCEEVQAACELLGFDPLYVANEGRFICFVPPEEAERCLALLRANPLTQESSLIGRVVAPGDASLAPGTVTLKTRIGATRIVDMLSGEQLPRIC